MSKLQKLVSLMMCVCMLLGTVALAEETTITEIAGDTVVASIYGEEITWNDVQEEYEMLVSNYGASYDLTLASNVDLFRAVALDNTMSDKVMASKAAELGYDQLTDEEIATAEATAQEEWDYALSDYISYFHYGEEETDEIIAEAEQYYADLGFDLDYLKAVFVEYAVIEKVQNYAIQDVVVTDEDVEAAYQALVEADKALYENDIEAYVSYNSYVDQMMMYYMMYGYSDTGMDYAWYRPEGFRTVKHILLAVDDTLMQTYTDLQARLEEQMNAEEVATEETEETEEVVIVTEEDVNNAEAAILESLADTIDAINQEIADGVDFDELIAKYAVYEDGTATDPGMVNEPTMTTGYEVSEYSVDYVTGFVEAAFSVDNIGDVSAPYLSDYGVHIVKYVADVEAGPIEMTDAQREAKLATLLAEKQTEAWTAAMITWMEEAGVEYTGVIPSMDEVETY